MPQLRIRLRWLIGLVLIGYVAMAWIYASAALGGVVRRHPIPSIAGVAAEDVALDAGGGITLDAGFYANPAAADCSVVMIHGIDDDRVGALAFAPIYWGLGCSIFAFDLRGHGRSSAAPHTFGYYEAEDADLAIDWVESRTGLPPSSIGIHGLSYGAATALEVLSIRDDLAFVVADSPFESMGAIVSTRARSELHLAEPLLRPLAFWLIEVRTGANISDAAPVEAVVAKSTPVLLLHTAADPIVPVEHTAAIAAANPAVERHVLDGGGIHLNAYFAHPDEYTAIVRDFVVRVAPDLSGQMTLSG